MPDIPLSGHVLVSPLRKVGRFSQLSPAEVSDLFLTVQKVDTFITSFYATPGSTITIQGFYRSDKVASAFSYPVNILH